MNTIAEINDFLLKGRMLAESLYKQHKIEEATLVLQISSKLALRELQGLEQRRKVTCYQCGRKLVYGCEIESYKHVGECFGCQNTRVDAIEDRMMDEDGEAWV